MEKMTQVFRLLGAGLAALAAGLLVAQRLKEAAKQAQEEAATEGGATKLERLMEDAAEQARKDAR